TFETGLDAVLAIDPIIYSWKPETGFDTAHVYTGFSAQNVREVIPEAIGTDSRGYLTFSERPVIAALVNAMQEQQRTIEQLTMENGQLTIDLKAFDQRVSRLEQQLRELHDLKRELAEIVEMLNPASKN
ncbi:MAG: tail fiber domain-containing protein, partial [Saprospiraceae bacterium]|nr:tail fiber domain-containing protein [Saprospiraceae bacterium]